MEKSSGMTLSERFYHELRLQYHEEILETEKRILEWKRLYIKHSFDQEGPKFKFLYDSDMDLLIHLKKQYKERYASTSTQHISVNRTAIERIGEKAGYSRTSDYDVAQFKRNDLGNKKT